MGPLICTRGIHRCVEEKCDGGVRISESRISQIRYSLVVILGLNSVSGVQYKDMMIDR